MTSSSRVRERGGEGTPQNKDIKELYNQTELNRTTVHKLPWARKANSLINFDILRQIFLSAAASSSCDCNKKKDKKIRNE